MKYRDIAPLGNRMRPIKTNLHGQLIHTNETYSK